MAIINFGGTKEEVVTRKEFSMARARKALKNETIAVIGYGVQGPAQALNLRDNGFNVIVGQRSFDRPIKDGWVPGKTLFSIEEAVRRGTIIQMLVSDAAQRAIWPIVKKNLKPGAALCFSHGFAIAYKKQTGIIAPKTSTSFWLRPRAQEPPSAAIS
jgi:ketol-acid reductoisomerase